MDRVDLSDGELKSLGYRRRFTASEPRLSEAVDLYQSIGYEVLLKDATRPDPDSEDCSACLDPTSAKTIYTRERQDKM